MMISWFIANTATATCWTTTTLFSPVGVPRLGLSFLVFVLPPRWSSVMIVMVVTTVIWSMQLARLASVILDTTASLAWTDPTPTTHKSTVPTLLTALSLVDTQVNINTLRPRQNGRHFTDDTFKCIFLTENVRNSFKISLKFVPEGLINNIPSFVQIMAWRRSGDKLLSEPMMIRLLTHICITRPQWVNIILMA